MLGTFWYCPRNGADTVSTGGSVTCKNYWQHHYLVRAERLRCTTRQFLFFSFLMVIFKVISISNPLKGLIMEKLEKYLYISPSRRHIGCKLCKRKFSHRFSKCKLDIGGQCRVAMHAMDAMRAPMSGQLRQGEMAPVLESFGALRKVKNEVFWP